MVQLKIMEYRHYSVSLKECEVINRNLSHMRLLEHSGVSLHTNHQGDILPKEWLDKFVVVLSSFFDRENVPSQLSCYFANLLADLFPSFVGLFPTFYRGRKYSENALKSFVTKLPISDAIVSKLYLRFYDDLSPETPFFFHLEDFIEDYCLIYLKSKFDSRYPGFSETLYTVGVADQSGNIDFHMETHAHYEGALKGYLEANDQSFELYDLPDVRPFVLFFFSLRILRGHFRICFKKMYSKLSE